MVVLPFALVQQPSQGLQVFHVLEMPKIPKHLTVSKLTVDKLIICICDIHNILASKSLTHTFIMHEL